MESKLIRSKSQLETTLAKMENYEKKRNYLAAQKAKEQSEKLRLEIMKMESHERKHTQERDLADIEDFHRQQIELLEKYWITVFEQLNQEREDLFRKQYESHLEQKRLIELQVESQIDQFRESGVVLGLSKRQKSLAKLHKFQEAKTIQEQKNRMIEMERKNWENLLQQKLKNRLRKLQTKQEQEKKVLFKKLESKMDESKKRREKEFDQMRKKHNKILRNCKAMHQKQNMGSAGNIKISTVGSLVTSRQRINSPMTSRGKSKKLQLQSI